MTIAMYKRRSLPRAFPAALLLAALAVPAARADRIDGELVKLTTKVLDYARDNKAKTIGVLKFRASRDDGKEDFHLGPINNLIADRLENTLVLGYNTDPDWPIDVIHDATAVAARKGLSYLPAEKAAELFGLQFPLVATGKQVTPDLFLTGVVHFDTQKHTTTVLIQSFTKEHPELKEVAQFTVPTERTAVAESGRSFIIERSLAERDAGPSKEEAKDESKDSAKDSAGAAAEKAAAKAAEVLQPPKESPAVVQPVATPDRLVDIRVLYNDEPVTLEPDARDPGGRAFARDPKQGDVVKFHLVNRSDSRVAIALLVNGSNTIKQERTEPRYCTKWILAPHKKLEIEGFYLGDTGQNNVKPFTVLSNEESEALFEMNSGDMRNERLGTISMHVFVEGERAVLADAAAVTRGLSPLQYQKEAANIKNIDDLSKLMYASAERGKQDRMLKRGLIADDGKAQNGSRLVEEDFKNPTEVQHLLIRYYQRKQK